MKMVYEYEDIINALKSGLEWEEYDVKTKACLFEKEYAKIKKEDLAFLLKCIEERNEELKVLKSLLVESEQVWEVPVQKPDKIDNLIQSAKEELEEESFTTFKEKMKELEEER